MYATINLADTNLCGVYSITNLVNGKRYIGSTAQSFRKRWQQHKTDLRRQVHISRHLQSAWVKYGEDAFEFSIICTCQPEHCLEMEQYFLDRFETYKPENGYNANPIAGSNLGRKFSAEVRAKISAAMQGHKRCVGRVLSPETRAKMSAAHLGKKMPDSFRAKMSLVHKGRKRSEQNKISNSLAMKKRWSDPIQRENMRSAIAASKSFAMAALNCFVAAFVLFFVSTARAGDLPAANAYFTQDASISTNSVANTNAMLFTNYVGDNLYHTWYFTSSSNLNGTAATIAFAGDPTNFVTWGTIVVGATGASSLSVTTNAVFKQSYMKVSFTGTNVNNKLTYLGGR